MMRIKNFILLPGNSEYISGHLQLKDGGYDLDDQISYTIQSFDSTTGMWISFGLFDINVVARNIFYLNLMIGIRNCIVLDPRHYTINQKGEGKVDDSITPMEIIIDKN